jgi:chemotaxis protein histidine kinase CheA
MGTSGGSGGIDPVMLELFAAEADTHLPVLSEGLLALEKGRAGKKEIESMMRAAHSIKGAARIVGNDPAVRIAHALEDCFTAAKEERIALRSEIVDILLQGVDALQRTCAADAEPEMNEEEIGPLLQRIMSVRDGKMMPPPASSEPSLTPMAAAPAIALAAPALLTPNILVLPAVFDSVAAESLRARFCDFVDLRTDPIRIDFGQVTHLSVAALSLLLSFAGEVRGLRPPAVIEAFQVSPAIRALFRVVGLESAFAPHD